MKVDFLDKYGLASEYAAARQRAVVLLTSGMFAPDTLWDEIIPDPTKTENDGSVSGMAFMLAETGSLVAVFDDMPSAYTWLRELHSNHTAYVTATSAPVPLHITAYDVTGHQTIDSYVHLLTTFGDPEDEPQEH